MININYYNEIKGKLIKCEIYDKVRDYSKERNRINTYFEVGKILSEAGKHYGENIIGQYSEKLILEVGKKYNYRTLYRMRKLYECFSSEKLTPLVSKLSWSHCLVLLSIKNINKINYYANQVYEKSLSKRQLQELIKSKEYERLPEDTKLKLIKEEKLKLDDLVPNPIIIKTNKLAENITEYLLKELILDSLDVFLNQLGSGFTYVGNEYKIKIGNSYNYIDLLLFNYEFNCFVVIELKITELKKEHIGQIQVYMNYIDNNLRKFNQDKTIGIIICKRDNKFVMEYSSDPRIISREFYLMS